MMKLLATAALALAQDASLGSMEASLAGSSQGSGSLGSAGSSGSLGSGPAARQGTLDNPEDDR